jgi:hypothetical protein
MLQSPQPTAAGTGSTSKATGGRTPSSQLGYPLSEAQVSKYAEAQREVRGWTTSGRAVLSPAPASGNSALTLLLSLSPPPPAASPLISQVIASDTAYLSSYPELPALLSAFTHAVLKEKPSNLKAFAKEYFSREE